MNSLSNLLMDKIMLFDGAMGTMLQKYGLSPNDCPELWNDTHPDFVKEIYESYKSSGSSVIQTNTFGGNSIKLKKFDLQDRAVELNKKAVLLAKEVMRNDGYVAASIGPSGDFLIPYGSLSSKDLYNAFKEQVIAVSEAGADFINIETMMDLSEARIALLAALENTDIPVICSFTFEKQGRTLMGNPPEAIVYTVQSLGASAVGANCSGGPKDLLPVISKMKKASSIPVIVQPNAGLPQIDQGEVVYSLSPEQMVKDVVDLIGAGANMIGGCCGTTPDHIKKLADLISGLKPIESEFEPQNCICSKYQYTPVDNLFQRLTEICVDANTQPFDIMDKMMESDIEDPIPLLIFDIEMDPQIIKSSLADIQSIVKQPMVFKINDVNTAKIVLRHYDGRAGILTDSIGNTDLSSVINKYGAYIINNQ